MTEVYDTLTVYALRTTQGIGIDVYAFFLYGSDITRIADISRISRDEADKLRGFQRKEIQHHVNSIAEYLDSEVALFPNAIILALSSEVHFKQSRGPNPNGIKEISQSGTLSIPIYTEGRRAAWIVDGQQRSLALSRSKNKTIRVPVIGFTTDETDIHREQFILVNKAKPLSTRLINELLPEANNIFLPRDLLSRKLPSELCHLLNTDCQSPFYKLIRRESDAESGQAMIIDTAVIESIKRNLKPPLGALSQFKGGHENNPEEMYRVLHTYWNIVKETFPAAWGKSISESRLMHSAGIRVMGALMDPIMLRADSASNPELEISESLKRIVPYCRWTGGEWEKLGWKWNDIQNTSKHINQLSDYLIRLDRDLSRRQR